MSRIIQRVEHEPACFPTIRVAILFENERLGTAELRPISWEQFFALFEQRG